MTIPSLLPLLGPQGATDNYIGPVAGHCTTVNHFYAGFPSCSTATGHIAAVNITSLAPVFANWRVDDVTTLEVPGEVPANYYASIEYPYGTYTRVKFGGNDLGICQPGEELEADQTHVNIPAGAYFRIHSHYSMPGGTGINMTTGGAPGGRYMVETSPVFEGSNYASGVNVPNIVMGGGTGGRGDGYLVASGQHFHPPIAIVGPTTQKTAFILGDSITVGANDTFDTALETGLLGRLFAGKYGYIKAGRGGTRTYDWDIASAFPCDRALSLYKYCSHVCVALGTNDLVDGTAAATILTRLQSLKTNRFPDKPMFVATIVPRTTDATNVSALTAPAGFEANRQALNVLLRKNPFQGLIDFDAAASAAGYAQPLWKSTDFLNTDGTHPSQLGNIYIAANTKIPF